MPDHSAPSDARTYAWNWFALHSSQRMQLVNFWLVAVAFLAAAFVQASTNRLRAIAVGVALAGALASLAFAALDSRTRNLIKVSENALRQIEDELDREGPDKGIKLVGLAHTSRISRASSYRFIIQGMQITIAALFTAGGFLATFVQ